jgi:hypothetical protein
MSESQTIVIGNERLTVEIARPGTQYTGTRFDWTAFITQVTCDGHTFCVPESREPGEGTGGEGLCNEFGIEQAIGYEDAEPGECFPKLGIGLLVRPDDEPYNFFRPHEIAEHFPIDVEVAEDRAIFTVAPKACRGYAARLVKTVSVQSAILEIAYRLENVGERPIVTREYCHNFVGIDGHHLGPDYRLRVPYDIELEPLPVRMQGLTEDLVIEDGVLYPKATPEHPFYCRLRGASRSDAAQWTLTHEPSRVQMSEYDDFAPVRVAVWGTTHVISAEIFVGVDVLPGVTQTWTRRYTFVTS